MPGADSANPVERLLASLATPATASAPPPSSREGWGGFWAGAGLAEVAPPPPGAAGAAGAATATAAAARAAPFAAGESGSGGGGGGGGGVGESGGLTSLLFGPDEALEMERADAG